MRRKALWFFCGVLLAAGLWPAASPAPVAAAPRAQSSTLTPLGPAACPAAGCAAGQRLSYRIDFELGAYAPSPTEPNVDVCVYIPAAWHDPASVAFDGSGGISAVVYSPLGSCAHDPSPPAGYQLAAGGEAIFNANYFNDMLNLSFRIARGATTAGSVLVRVFERGDTGAWTRTAQIFTPQMQVAPRAATVYVAPDAAACSATPCYLNSAGDLADGLGTGLKDAIDALDEGQPNLKVVVLETVGLKSNPVLVNKPLTLEGSGDAGLTAAGGFACSANAPLLRFTAGGALRALNLSDGSCAGADNRPLVVIDSPGAMTIEGNDLLNGADAIRVTGGGAGDVLVRYNHIRGNAGYALLWDNTSAARLDLVANNLSNNRSGDAVECALGAGAAAANRVANHNYWGGGAPGAGTHCNVGTGKHLGAPIAKLADAPGVDARRVTVTTSKTYAFNNRLAYARSGGSDFDLYLVNHGSDFPEALPFAGTFAMPNPCTNVYDVFLAGGAPADTTLDLSLSYGGSAACIAAVEMSSYCEQSTSPQSYPLYWYDPAGSVTDGWDTTGQSPAGSGAGGAGGQTTRCELGPHEIKASIDTSGRPGLGNDLNFTPFLVGLPVPATFAAFASNQTVTLVWTTVSEPDITGFTVLRSLSQGGPYEPVSDLITRKGAATSGTTYSFADGGRTNGVTNYYRLQTTRSDGGTILSNVVAIVPNVATVTPTRTVTPSLTPRPTFTPYSFPTSVFQPTRAFSATPLATSARTSTPSPSAGPGTTYPTLTGTLPTSVPGLGSVTPSPETSGYPAPEVTGSGTPGGSLTPTPDPSTPTITPTASRTAAPTLSRAAQIRGASRFISLVMGLLVSATMVTGLTWLLFRRRKTE